jgi:hypothetical protein
MIQLKDVIHYYIGQPCRVKDVGRAAWISMVDEFGGVTAKLQGRPETVYEAAEGVNPILRRLEDMTEDEALECAQEAIHEIDLGEVKIWRNEKFNFVMLEWGIEKRRIMDFTVVGFYTPAQFHWLTRKGFDLFDLIHDRQAIDAKTIKQ